MNAEKLKTILDNHKKWLDTNGKEGCKADLSGCDLRDSNLRGCDLSDSNLRGC